LAHASLGLRGDQQDALKRAAADYGLVGIRQHGIFDDDMHVVSLDTGGGLVFNWTSVDTLWDAHVNNKVAPLVELSFMPWCLANCSSVAHPHQELPTCVQSERMDPHRGRVVSPAMGRLVLAGQGDSGARGGQVPS